MKNFVKYPVSVLKFFLPQSTRDWALGTPLFLAVVFVGYSLFLDRDPVTPLEPTQLASTSVRQGDLLRIQYNVHWNSNCRITGYRVIVDSGNRTYPFDPDSRLVMQGPDSFEISLRIPSDSFLGEAHYGGYVEYECNWLQRQFPLRKDLIPRPFTILPAMDEIALTCPWEQPVAVRAHCRSFPVASTY